MVNPVELQNRQFADLFNWRLGAHTGRPITASRPSQRQVSDELMRRASAVRAVTGQLSKSGRSGGGAKKKPRVEKYVGDDVTTRATAEALSKQSKDLPWWADALNAVSKPLDIISRPGYAVAEGLRNTAESINAGEPLWSVGDDIATGAARGLWGTRKTGGGEVIEEMTKWGEDPNRKQPLPFKAFDFLVKNNPITLPYRILEPFDKNPIDLLTNQQIVSRERENSNPDTGILTGDPEVQAKRLLGILTGVATDPTTYVGGKFLTGFKGPVDELAEVAAKGGVTTTAEATKEATKAATKDAVRRVLGEADEAADASSILRNVKKGTRRLEKIIDQDIDEFADEFLTHVASGPQAGKALYGKEMPAALATRVSNRYRETLLDELTAGAERIIKGYGKSVAEGGLSAAHLNNMRKASPLVAKYLDQLKYLTGKLPGEDINKLHQQALRLVTRDIDEVAVKIRTEALRTLSQSSLRVPVIKILGKDAIHLRRTASLADRVGKRAGDTVAGDTLKRAFSYGEHFPGYTGRMAARVKSRAYKEFEDFHREVSEATKGLSRADRKALSHAINNNEELSGPLEVVRKQIQKWYDDILDVEDAAGIRDAGRVRGENYHYIFNKGGTQTARREFKEARKAQIQKYANDAGFGFNEAKKKGLRPEEDAIRNLLHRKQKSMRDLTRSWFLDDLTGNFGVGASRLAKGTKEAAELAHIDRRHLGESLKAGLKADEEMYLPQKIKDVYDAFHKMSSMASTDEQRQLLRAVDWLTRKFRYSATIPFPSYHVRNMLGDVYMGFLDGVRLKDYKKFLGGVGTDEAPRMVRIGGETMPIERLRAAYEETASSAGFFQTDVGKGISRGVGEKLRGASQAREDLGRFVHFSKALDDEYGKLAHIKDPAERWAKAKEAAVYRVNKYKFDYGALTPTETNVAKRLVPFYTYMRKAAPTLVESMFLNPKIFSYTNKIFEDTLGDGTGISDMLAPEWMRSIGGTTLGDENEPTVFRHDVLPTSLFSNLLSPGEGSPVSNLAQNFLGMANPLAQAPFELMSGKDTFTGKSASNPLEILKNKTRPVGFLEDLFEQILDPEKRSWQKGVSMGTGVGFTKVSKEMQEFALKEMEDNMQNEINSFNKGYANKGYALRYYINPNSRKIEFRVMRLNADPERKDKKLATFDSLEAAKRDLKSRAG